jgi:hypothetical protein
MTGRRWGRRVVGGVIVYAILEGVLSALDFDPRPLRLGLLVGLCLVVSGLVRDSFGDSGPPWSVETVRPMVQPWSDARLGAHVRLIESHLTAQSPDGALRDRLAALCDERLLRTRGLRRSDPRSEALLGRALLDDLTGPPGRLTRSRIDEHLRRIEEL